MSAATAKPEELERKYLLANYSPDGVRTAEGLLFVKGAWAARPLGEAVRPGAG